MCFKQIDDLIVSLKDIIVLTFYFGDHGTRIQKFLQETTSNEDLVDNHSAIFFLKQMNKKEMF